MAGETGAPLLLGLALLALGAGPLLRQICRRVPQVMPSIDGFVIGTIGALALGVLLPNAFRVAGWPAAGAAALGLFAFAILEKVSHVPHARLHQVGRGLAVVALVVHMFFDGLALFVGQEDGSFLAVGVVLHRIPAAVAVWWLVRPTMGAKVGGFVLGLAAIATTAGYFVGAETLQRLDGTPSALFQAFVTGTLLHVLVHGRHDPHRADALPISPRAPVLETIGAVVGVGMIVLMTRFFGHEHHEESHAGHGGAEGYGERLLELALETAPALLLGSIMAGAVIVFLPRASVRWLGRGNSFSQALRGTAFGIPIPICSCGVVPLYQSMVKQGAPAAAGFAFLIATPELGLESLLMSVPLLGWKLTGMRLLCAVAAALFVGAFVSRFVSKKTAAVDVEVDEPRRPLPDRIRAGLDYGFVEVVGDTAVWILLGLAIAATVNATTLGAWFSSLPTGTDVLFAAVIGLPIYVCASGATPLAAALLFAGLSPGAAIAFLLSGPASNVTTFGVLARLHGQKAAIVFAGAVIASAIGLGFATNLVLGASTEIVEVASAHESHGLVAWASLVVMGAAYSYALLRQGPGAFFAPVLSLVGPGGSDHDHSGHDHSGHDHSGHDHDGHDHDGRDHNGHDHGGHGDEETSKACGGCGTDC